ncbi:hypothetical protein ACQEU3_36780 [Spirillospora sp. CA-253888]
MKLISFPVLVLAAVLDGRALWHAFVTGELEVSTALTRYLVAVLVSAAMVWVLTQLTAAYTRARPGAGDPQDGEITVTAEQVGTPFGRRAADRARDIGAQPTRELPPGP